MRKTGESGMTFSAVLLAGGESRRMGRDKAAVVFRDEPLWRRQIELLRALKPAKVFVSARTKPSWLPRDVELLLDDPPSRGPLSGLTKALQQMQTSHLIALAVDMPWISTDWLGHLCSVARPGRGVVPMIRDRTEPLAAIYPADARSAFTAALAGANFSLQRLIRKLAAEKQVRLLAVPAQDEYLFRSVNEPADFKERRSPARRS